MNIQTVLFVFVLCVDATTATKKLWCNNRARICAKTSLAVDNIRIYVYIYLYIYTGAASAADTKDTHRHISRTIEAKKLEMEANICQEMCASCVLLPLVDASARNGREILLTNRSMCVWV